MKKITALFPDNVEIDFTFLSKAVELKMETIADDKEPPKPARTAHRGSGGETMMVVAASHYTPEGVFTRDHMKAWLTLKKFNETSVSPAISRLKKDGLIRDLGAQKYQWKAPPPAGYK